MSWNGEERRGENVEMNRKFDVIFEKLEKIDEALNGNGKVGIRIELDRNTQFRKGLVKALWFLLTPLYVGMITALVNSILKIK